VYVRYLLVFFIAIPLVEMLILFEVSDAIGGWPTLGLVVLTAVIGVQVLKRQGLSTLTRANKRVESGQLPAQEMVEGMFLAGAGALLLTPGFLTDTLGFLFLTPQIRARLAGKIIRSGMVMTSASQGAAFQWHTSTTTSRSGGTGGQTGKVYEGEYVEQSGEIQPPESGSRTDPPHKLD